MNQAEVKRRQIQAATNVFALIVLAIITRMTGYNGVTYVAVGLEVYALLYTLVSGGVSETLGRLLRSRNTKGQYRNAEKMRRHIMLLQLVFGALGTVVMLLTAEVIAVKVFRIPYSVLILRILAPAVLLRSVSAVLQGYAGGTGQELPTAAAGILRQLFTLGFSVMFCKMLGAYGEKVSHLLVQENFTYMYSGVGVAIAVTLAEVFVVVFLFLLCRMSRKSSQRASQDGMRTIVSLGDSVRMLSGNRAAMMGIQLLAILFLPVGVIFLQKAGNATVEYGIYISGYGVVCGSLIALVMITAIPLCGKIAGLLRREEHRFAKSVFQSGIHILIVYTGFLAVLLGVLAEQMAAVVCKTQPEAAARMFRGGSSLIVFVVLALYFARMLMLSGRKYLVFAALALGNVVYAVSAAVMLNVGKAGILALIYAGLMGGAVTCIALGVFAYAQFRQRINWMQVLVIPLAAACITGIVAMLLGKVLTPHLGNLITLLVCLAACAVLYWAGLLLLRNFSEQELENIPGGKWINALGQMLHVL